MNLVKLAGYYSSYFTRILRKKKYWDTLLIDNKIIKCVAGEKNRYCNYDTLIALKKFCKGTDCTCSKRLTSVRKGQVIKGRSIASPGNFLKNNNFIHTQW